MTTETTTETPATTEAANADAPADTLLTPAETKVPAEDTGNPEKKADTGAPEKYDFKMPDGIEVDAATLEAFTPVAKELNLTQEQAQKLVDLHAQTVANAQKAIADGYSKLRQDWRDSAVSDKEYGGQEFQANLGTMKKALDTFGTPALIEALNLTGMGNHPELLRFFYKVGQTLKDADIKPGSPAPGQKAPLANRLYPSMASN